ncbi:MAG: hypothetical protein IPN86_21105 [Saprospiraceae bacterium]|nr:hypothetical protein [Saprospiraceae bacterium]
MTARDQNVCHGGVGVELSNFTGNPEDWGVFLYTDCALTDCIPHASYWDFGNGAIYYEFEVPDGESIM